QLASPPAAAPSVAASSAASPDALAERVRTLSSPLVRNIAREHGVDLAGVPGTGIHGRVTKQDILGYLEQRPSAPPAAAAKPAGAPAGKVDTGFRVPAYTAGENVTIEPMSKIRQITAAHMRYSKDTSAHVTTVFHMDFTKIHRVRERARAGFQEANGTKLSYMPFIFKAVCNALKSNPKLNAAVDGTNVVFKKDINLGMAVALDWGLLVPVIKQADTMNLIGLAKAANDLADRARAKRLKPEEVQGGTFTITNPGVFGSLFGTPIINQPQVAILGIGTIEKRPIVMADADGSDTIAIRVMSYFGITYDHRLVDGADADHFMNDVKKTLESDAWPELNPYL
ncbi:MAG TPA: dihydrolipoamide acetyltransferase family protein, partial [Thermoanaerobaculia bacterium]|nr:dihydrolipoamide acetyltransferase family protein [Thermoanaerobaculia bacterium]